MKKAILATKIGMTQIFAEDGELIPVTVLQAGPCEVTQVKTVENDGYSAVQVGFQDMREKLSTKPMKGHFEKAGVSVKRFVKEFKLDDAENYELGQKITVDVFEAGDKVDATAISKGKGFQGAIKRHGQHTGPKTHGSKYHRHAGSNGMASDPSKVMKGKKMPGQMGHVQITIQNLEVVKMICELLEELVSNKPNHIKYYEDLMTFVKDRPGHDVRYSLDCSKIHAELGWQPQITFEQGLRQTVKWYLENNR